MIKSLKPGRLGFTLIELLVVMAIIAVLVGILVPAVQKVREAASRTSCINNAKQIGLAILNFEAAYKKLPSSGEGVDPAAVAGKAYEKHATFTHLLPFVEQNAIYKQMDLTQLYNDPTKAPQNVAASQTNVPVYLCPSAEGMQADPGGYGQISYMIIAYTDISPTGLRDVPGSIGPFNKKGTPGLFGWRSAGALRIYGNSGGLYDPAGLWHPLSDTSGATGFGNMARFKQNYGTMGSVADGTSNTMIMTEDSSYRVHRTIFPYQFSGARDPYAVASGINDNNSDGSGNRALNRWADVEASANGISGPPGADPNSAQYTAATTYDGPWVNQAASPIGGALGTSFNCTWDMNNCGPNDEPFGPHAGGVVSLFLDGHVGLLRADAGMGNVAPNPNLIWRLVVPNDGFALDLADAF